MRVGLRRSWWRERVVWCVGLWWAALFCAPANVFSALSAADDAAPAEPAQQIAPEVPLSAAEAAAFETYIQAAHDGDRTVLAAQLKDHPAFLDRREPQNHINALFCAMYSDQLATFTWLLDHGADPNTKLGDGTPILMVVLEENKKSPEKQVAYAQALAAHGVDPTVPGYWGAPLSLALEAGNPALLKVLVDACTDPVKAKAALTPLLLQLLKQAALHAPDPPDPNFTCNIQLLVEHHADPNVTDDQGCAALGLLLAKPAWGSKKLPASVLAGVAKVLVAAGADPNHADAGGHTPTTEALEGGDWEALAVLVANGANPNAVDVTYAAPLLYRAIYADSVPLIRLALEKGAKVDGRTRGGTTALMLVIEDWDEVIRWRFDAGEKHSEPATEADQVAMAEELLAHGANPNQAAFPGISILGYAYQRQEWAVVLALVRHGANPNQIVSGGEFLLIGAIQQRSLDLVDALLDRGADPNATVPAGRTALATLVLYIPQRRPFEASTGLHQEGVQPNELAILQVLIDHGADVNEPGVLEVAVQVDDPAVASLLLEHGAQPNTRGPTGSSAFEWVARFGGPAKLELLIGHGGDPLWRDSNGDTVLMKASTRNFNRLYAVARPFDTGWLLLVWLAFMVAGFAILRRPWRRRLTVLEGALQSAPAGVALAEGTAMRAAAAPPPASEEAAVLAPATAAMPAGPAGPAGPVAPAKPVAPAEVRAPDTSVAPAVAPSPKAQAVAHLEKTIVDLSARQERARQVALLALVSWFALGLAHAVDPVLRAETWDSRGVLGALLFVTLLALALLFAQRRWMIVAGLTLSMMAAVAQAGWALVVLDWLRQFPATLGLQVLIGAHLLAAIGLAWQGWRVLRVGERADYSRRRLNVLLRIRRGRPDAPPGADDDFDVPAGWDERGEAER